MKNLLLGYLNHHHKDNGIVTKIYTWTIYETNCVVSYELINKWEHKTINIWDMITFLNTIKNENE